MKYIVFKLVNGEVEREVPIAFPNFLVHADVAKAMRRIRELSFTEVVSAGEFSSIDANIDCHGKNKTLKVKSRKEVDSQLFKLYDYTHSHL